MSDVSVYTRASTERCRAATSVATTLGPRCSRPPRLEKAGREPLVFRLLSGGAEGSPSLLYDTKTIGQR
jgi:hypothetical protein